MSNTISNTTVSNTSNSMNNSPESTWITICDLDDIPPNTGVCAELNGQQVAVFHIKNRHLSSQIKAVDNFDPFGKANVLSRGLITEIDNKYFIASPLLKQQFCLDTGQHDQDESIVLATYQARIEQNTVQLKG